MPSHELYGSERLIRYVSKHPKCSFEQIAIDLYGGNVCIAIDAISHNIEFFSARKVWFISEYGDVETYECIHINTIGAQYIEDKNLSRNMFIISILISSLAILFSILKYFK